MAPEAPDSGVRQAALVLHAMNEQDRAWMLDRLGMAAKQALLPLLDELSSLRFPRDAAVIQKALASPIEDSTKGVVSVEALCRVLANEPVRTRSVVLSMIEESARDAVLSANNSRLSIDRSTLATLQASAPNAPALRRAVDASIRRLAETSLGSSAA
jgi:hypothetical protein